MKLCNTKVGKILFTDWVDLFIDRVIFDMGEKEYQKRKKSKMQLVKYKRKYGLTEEERLCPADSKCDHDYIKNIEIVEQEPFQNSSGETGTIVHQKVTYVDESIRYFDCYTTLSGISFPPGYFEFLEEKEKIKILES